MRLFKEKKNHWILLSKIIINAYLTKSNMTEFLFIYFFQIDEAAIFAKLAIIINL